MPKRKPSAALTRAYLDQALKHIGTKIDHGTETLKESIRGLNQNFIASQGGQNTRLDEMDAKLDAIMEMLTTRKELKNLVRELRAQGIAIDAAKVFVG